MPNLLAQLQAVNEFREFADRIVDEKFLPGEFKDNKTTIEITLDELYAIAHTKDFLDDILAVRAKQAEVGKKNIEIANAKKKENLKMDKDSIANRERVAKHRANKAS